MPARKSHANGDSSLGAFYQALLCTGALRRTRLFQRLLHSQESLRVVPIAPVCNRGESSRWQKECRQVLQKDKNRTTPLTSSQRSNSEHYGALWDNEHPQNYLHAPPTFFHPNCISATFHFCRAAYSRHRLHFHSNLGRSKYRVLFGRQKCTRPPLKRTACSSLATGSNTRPSHSRGRFGKTSVA